MSLGKVFLHTTVANIAETLTAALSKDVFLKERKEVYNNDTVLYRGDQSDVAFLEYVLEDSRGEFDVIIDDGSHVPDHQILTFNKLFGSLKPGGLYIFEDIETSYWNREGTGIYGYVFRQPLGIGSANSVIEKFKRVVDWGINNLYHCNHNKTRTSPASGIRSSGGCGDIYHCDSIASVVFEQNIIMLRKKDENDANFMARDRVYPHTEKLK